MSTEFNINIAMESALSGAEISIVSMLGEQIWLRKLGDEKEMEFPVDLSGFADGTYICTFRNGDRVLKTVKLSKARR